MFGFCLCIPFPLRILGWSCLLLRLHFYTLHLKSYKQKRLQDLIHGWPRMMLCKGFKKHKLCSSWSIYPCHGKVYCQRERLHTAFCIKETRSTHKLHLAEHQLEMGVSEIRPQMTIFFGTTPDKPIIIIYPFENRWNSLKHCWYRAVWGCALSCWRYLSWWQWCHCLRSQSRIVCWPSIEWRWIWNDLKWSGMMWDGMR